MYTEEQYQRAKQALDDPEVPEDRKPGIRKRVAEYEASRQEVAPAPATAVPAAPSAAPEEAPPELAAVPDRNAQVAEILGKYGAPAPQPAPEAQPAAERPAVNSIEMPKEPEPIDQPEDPGRDSSLNNASKLLRFKDIPNEHKSNSHSALGVIANNMAHRLGDYSGASSTMWFEPSREKFETDMGAYLKTKGLTRDNPAYERAYDTYRDSEWKKAYQEAVINDLPITRAEFSRGDSGWEKVENFLGRSADAATAFADGMARGYAGPVRGLAVATRDRLTGRDDLGEMREREERHPWISGTGAFVGSLLPGNVFGKVAGKVYGTPAEAASTAAKLTRAGLAGSVAADVDLIANTLGTGIENIIKGTPTKQSLEAIEQLPQKLGVSSLLGFGGGVAGELIAKAAGALRKGWRSPGSELHPSLPNAEATGSQTSFIHGFEPNEQLKAIVEKARGPVPGEDRAPIMASPVAVAAEPAIAPIVDQQHRALEFAKMVMGAEKQRYVEFHPVLKNQTIEPTNILDGLYNGLVQRSKLGPNEFPSPGDALGAWNTNQALFNTYKGLVKPIVHLEADLPAGSMRPAGSRYVSVAQARELGFDIQPPKIRQPPMPSRPPPSMSEPPPPMGGPPTPRPELPPPPMSKPVRDLSLSPSEQAAETERMWVAVRRLEAEGKVPPGWGASSGEIPPDWVPKKSTPLPTAIRPFDSDLPLQSYITPPSNDNSKWYTPAPLDKTPLPADYFLVPRHDTLPSARTPVPPSSGSVDTPRIPDSQASIDTPRVPDYHPESAFVVELKPIPQGPMAFESVVESIDNAGKASSANGHKEQIWNDLIAIARKDRDKFNDAEWSRMYNRHDELLRQLKDQAKYAGINEDETYAKMSPGNRQIAENTIRGYPHESPEKNQALTDLADAAGRVNAYQAEVPGRYSGRDTRHDLEGIRAVRGYLDLKEKASLSRGLTSGGGPFGLGGLLPGTKLRLDAIARGLAHDTQGRPLYVPGVALPGRRSLLPGVAGGGLGVFAGVPFESATNADRARSTGTLDKEQMRIIDEALRQK